MTKFEVGDLVSINIIDSGFTLCFGAGGLREHSHYNLKRYPYDGKVESLGGTVALITEVILNKLQQPLGYCLLQGEETHVCKAIWADKYLTKIS
jgi:hypothetical protein